MKHRAWLLLLIIPLVAAFTCRSKPPAVQYAQTSHDATQRPSAIDFTLADLSGVPHTLAGLGGKVLIVDFWATWCPPCRAEIPELVKLYNTYSGQGLVIWGVAVDKKEDVQSFLGETPVPYPVMIDGGNAVATLYKVAAIPTTVVIDRKGRIAYRHTGFTTDVSAELVREVEALLAEPLYLNK